MDYLVLSKDGQEYGPADVETLRTWLAEGRLDGSTQLREAIGGRLLYASTLSELWQAGAMAPKLSENAPSPDLQAYLAGQSDARARGYFTWSLIEATLGVVMFFGFNGIGLVFCGFSVYNAFRARSLGHPAAWFAITVSLVSLLTVSAGWLSRGIGP